ncbi:aspartate/glutamate racemase family protein [Pasteurella multocida]|uniref:aspartate/glutamate racemase family protein n=1 Tax=Pasteurella multocida TaxID=747 RepID=UPI002020FA32|nr:aspartate/glutamate racemase family protein [Pasteurella multocida]MCL7826602.1 aspartate/glutamate racemase family protein [Pasteurella multocida]URI04422.1 aspartate/glutamate racemase family protein [Pasteurella multocida]HDR1314944.1 aspartate/glutamate racemase family protein [Pasteurella multocida]HDR1827206.1 aspartate/glutamate racemase family protein [Pasteurella multocida]
MKTLGIIGGMSPESTVTYYRLINQLINQTKSGNHSAPLVMVNVEFEQIVCLQKQGEWHKAGEILATAAKKLTQIGAEGILLATNTMHKVAPQIIDVIDVPFLHIIDATAKAIKIKNLTQVALLGTQFTMQDPFYRDLLLHHDITPLVPNQKQQQEMHRIIFTELCVGQIKPESKQFYLDVINDLAKQGAQGVILGCTEIGLLINQQDATLPFFDTTTLHAQAAAEFILTE